MLDRASSGDHRKKTVRFTEGPIVDENVTQALRSPSRLGYTEEITAATERSLTENGSQDSTRDNFRLLDLEKSTQEQESYLLDSDRKRLVTKDTAQQTDSITRLSATGTPLQIDLNPKPVKEYVSSRKVLNDIGLSPKHPFEKTVFYVKSVPGEELTKTKEELAKGDHCGITNVLDKPISSARVKQADSQSTRKERIDSGYISRQETVRVAPQSAKSVSTTLPSEGLKSSNMSLYGTEVYSPPSSSRKQEKEDLQKLNERFTAYIQKIRQQNDQNVRIDANLFMQQTRILEEEVANLKTMYERELDAIRHELDATGREKNNYQIQCQKNKDNAIDLESRLSVETDKNRRLMDDLNLAQRRISNLETEVLEMRQAGDGRIDFQNLQREYDKILRENHDLKHRQEQESLLRTEADDHCHSLTKKMEFNDQVHAQQIAELRERLEQSAATVISLESRVRDLTKTDMSIPQVLQQVRDNSEMELRRYQMESEEQYNRNIAALKCQMDNDAHTIEKISGEKSLLQGQIGELQAKIRTLEGQISILDHQKTTVEDLIKQQRARSQEQVQEMEKKLHDMQELVFTKMREANSARDLNIPLKAEIDAMKALLEEEEKRLQTPLTPLSYQQTSYISPQPTLPVIPPASQAPPIAPRSAPPGSLAQHVTAKDTTFITQSMHEPLIPSAPLLSPVITQDLEPPVSSEPLFTISAPVSATLDSGMQDYTVATKYTYETTPSINRLQIEPSSYQMASPRVVGPISRAKSAPAHSQRHTVPLVPANLGQGKDYFDEMFKDLTRETLYTQTRPKSSPTERQPVEPEPAVSTEKPPSPRAESPVERPPSVRPSSERPPSSVYHDYTTTTSSAVGDIKILEVNQEGRYVRLVNEGKQEVEFGGYMIQQNVGGHPVAVYRFPPRTKFPDSSTITVWAGMTDPLEHQPPKDYVWTEQQKWGTGPECTTILCKPNGQAIAWTTAAHRFTKNPYEDSPIRPSSEVDHVNTEKETAQENILTEVNVNLNEPKPEPVFLRREKQSPPSLLAQKHPHGSNPSRETHPHTGQPRPFTYGNDNSSVNRQSRVQTTRPDPIQGQPYAGGPATRIGSAPLRKYNPVASGNIRGSGALANRSDPGVTSPPPTPFQSPKKRFETGLEQVISQHHADFLPPMPRPPLFSAW